MGIEQDFVTELTECDTIVLSQNQIMRMLQEQHDLNFKRRMHNETAEQTPDG